MFHVNNRNIRKRCEVCLKFKKRHLNDGNYIVLVSLLLTLNIFHTFFYSLHRWLWTRKCWLGSAKSKFPNCTTPDTVCQTVVLFMAVSSMNRKNCKSCDLNMLHIKHEVYYVSIYGLKVLLRNYLKKKKSNIFQLKIYFLPP